MAVEGMTPGIIATIVIVFLLAVFLVVLYMVCRSDDPARDHTCVAMLYPRTRRELRQLKIPLDPVNPTDVQVNQAFEEEKADTEQDPKQHTVEIHDSSSVTQTGMQTAETPTNENATSSKKEQEGFVNVGLQAAAIQ